MTNTEEREREKMKTSFGTKKNNIGNVMRLRKREGREASGAKCGNTSPLLSANATYYFLQPINS